MLLYALPYEPQSAHVRVWSLTVFEIYVVGAGRHSCSESMTSRLADKRLVLALSQFSRSFDSFDLTFTTVMTTTIVARGAIT